MTAQRIRDDDGALTMLGRELGEERLHEFATGQGTVQAMALFLVMSVCYAPQAGYRDEALDTLIADAEDLRQAANKWADQCVDLAQAWRRQRMWDENERGA